MENPFAAATRLLKSGPLSAAPSELLGAVRALHSRGLDDVLLLWFFGQQRQQFAGAAEAFRRCLHPNEGEGGAPPYLTVPAAVKMAEACLRRSLQTGRVLSAAIHEARCGGVEAGAVHAGAPRDLTTEQLRAAFNVALFNTARPGENSHGSPRQRSRSSRSHMGALFTSTASKYFRTVFREIHRTAGFKKGGASSSDSDDTDESDESEDEAHAGSGSAVSDAELREGFAEVCAQLRSLDWMGRLEPAFTSVLYEELEATIKNMCSDRYSKSLLPKLNDWMERVALAWLSMLYTPTTYDESMLSSSSSSNTSSAFASLKSNVEFHMYQTFASLRISELFGIVRGFPETRAAIIDLRECLKRTHQHREVTIALRDVFESRLLIPHAETPRILSIYIQTIKSLRLLDATGVLLESVSHPIKSYLRSRDDTIRKIVSDLTDPRGGELFRELHGEGGGGAGGGGGNRMLIQQDGDGDDYASEDDHESAKNDNHHGDGGGGTGSVEGSFKLWMPDSNDADPSRSSRSRRLSDILSMLVQIYGSKKLFVTEYRRLLSQKLLKSGSFKTDDEVMTLELLELRFGEVPLHPCKIMMKDIDDSRRINKNIDAQIHQEALADPAPMRSTIISKEYWPKLLDEPPFKLHQVLGAAHEEFGRQFTKAKAPRKLIWKHNLGMVDLDLAFETGVVGQPKRSFNFQCTPAQASIILHLRDQPRISVRELAHRLGIQEGLVRRIAAKWVNLGVVREVSTSGSAYFEVVADYGYVDEGDAGGSGDGGAAASAGSANQIDGGDEDEDEGMLAQNQAQLEQQALVYENYVRGMLSNFGELPLDRIHNMLSMFVPGDDNAISVQQLRGLLSHLCNQEKLVFDGSAYKLT